MQDEAVGLIIESGRYTSRARCPCPHRRRHTATSVVITAGTFLRARMIAGESRTAGGRAGDSGDTHLSTSLSSLEFRLRRFKTGTPPRIDARTVDVSKTEPQPGDDTQLWMSRGPVARATSNHGNSPLPRMAFTPRSITLAGVIRCAAYQRRPPISGHEIIRENLHRAPMYNGSIEGTGPRYCPSIEDKVGRFRDKTSHPVFLEPEGWRSHEDLCPGHEHQSAARHPGPGHSHNPRTGARPDHTIWIRRGIRCTRPHRVSPDT